MAMGVPIVDTAKLAALEFLTQWALKELVSLVAFSNFTVTCKVPMATMVTGQSFGGSSFLSALSDYVVMVRGSCLAVTSPVFEITQPVVVSFEDVGGVDVRPKDRAD